MLISLWYGLFYKGFDINGLLEVRWLIFKGLTFWSIFLLSSVWLKTTNLTAMMASHGGFHQWSITMQYSDITHTAIRQHIITVMYIPPVTSTTCKCHFTQLVLRVAILIRTSQMMEVIITFNTPFIWLITEIWYFNYGYDFHVLI